MRPRFILTTLDLHHIQVLYILLVEVNIMSTVTVNVSFPKQLLRMMDAVAKREARSRSELLRAAVRAYVERRQRWDHLLTFWRGEARRTGMKPEDIDTLIAKSRRTQTSLS